MPRSTTTSCRCATTRNDYLIDRQVQKHDTFTGIVGVSEQDAAIQDSMGPIQDRTKEHLGPTDIGVVEFRKMLMGAARALQTGTAPKAAASAPRYAVRAGGAVAGAGQEPRRRHDRALRPSARLYRQPVRTWVTDVSKPKADNEFLTPASGKGTPMGALLRRFWMPALLSEELPERDGPPKKIRIMGEDLLAFRDSNGRVGIVEPHCPHRGANLYYGRNEECGLRCSFHGWKFDVEGNCVDLPTSPPEFDLQGHDQAARLSGARMGRHRLGLHGPARQRAGAAAARARAGAGVEPLRLQEVAGLQLGAEPRRRDRHRALLVPAQDPVAGREDQARDLSQHLGDRRRPGAAGPHPLGDGRSAAEVRDRRPRHRPGDRRRAQDRQHRQVLAHLAVPDAQPRARAGRLPGRRLSRPVLGAGR